MLKKASQVINELAKRGGKDIGTITFCRKTQAVGEEEDNEDVLPIWVNLFSCLT